MKWAHALNSLAKRKHENKLVTGKEKQMKRIQLAI